MELLFVVGFLILLGIYLDTKQIRKYLGDYFDATDFYAKKKEIDEWNQNTFDSN